MNCPSLAMALPKECKKGSKLPNKRSWIRRSQLCFSQTSPQEKAHTVAFHEEPAPAELDMAGTRFPSGASGDLGLSYSASGSHGGLHMVWH